MAHMAIFREDLLDILYDKAYTCRRYKRGNWWDFPISIWIENNKRNRNGKERGV